MRICLSAAIAAFLGLVALAPAAQPPASPIPPRTVTLNQPGATLDQVTAELSKQTGCTVTVHPGIASAECPAQVQNAPFWTALESVAKKTHTRIVLQDAGRKISLEPRGSARESSSIYGPFRTVSRHVVARYDLDLGHTLYSVQLDAHWEPRFPVFRISSAPQITKATDDRGTALTASAAKAFTQPSGWALHGLDPVRLSGLTRDSRSISVLAGSYTVTAADKMLAFRFDDLTAKLPLGLPQQEQVTATLNRFEKDDMVWEAEVELTYPAGQPHFESFEEGTWLVQNRMQLIPPGGGKAFASDDYQVLESGRRVAIIYRFKEDAAKGLVNPKAKGWSLVYNAPAPLVEFTIPFELKDIPLP